jgi:hypothetical protein
MVATAICVAMCRPANCYAGNCGLNDENRYGQPPHRCNAEDRVGTFSATEQCQFLWYREISMQAVFLSSRDSDALGFCFDPAKYQYDRDGDNMPDTPLPACHTLADGYGPGSNPADPDYWGASDLGCVDSTHGPAMAQTIRRPKFDQVRPLYRRVVAQ